MWKVYFPSEMPTLFVPCPAVRGLGGRAAFGVYMVLLSEHPVGAFSSEDELGGDPLVRIALDLFPNDDKVAGLEDPLLDSFVIFQVAMAKSSFVVENFQ